MPKLRVLTEPPPPERGQPEEQLRELRDYVERLRDELEYLLTHLETDNTNSSLWRDIDGQIPGSYGGSPTMDGTASPGVSGSWSRGDHRHPTDSSRASAAALAAHVGNTSNPHGVTKAQVGLGNVADERQYSADNPPPYPVTSVNGDTGAVVLDASDVGAIPAADKGAAGGVAELDSGGKIPTAQLPSYVDDVLEYASSSAFPAAGESGKIYVALDTNLTYRWSGSAYVEISPSLALGETSSTAYRGDRGKTAYDHSQLTGGNPHGVSAADVGLGNVDNVQQYSASNPPPYPVTSVNGSTGAVTVSVPSAYASNPAMDGTASPGSSGDWARGDHVHPTDTSRQEKITAFGILEGDGDGGITAAWIDVEPTENSGDLVESGGVYDAIRKRPRVADTLYNQATDVSGAQTITLSENVADYSYLAILMLTESASDYNHRATIVVPTISLGFNSWFPVIADNVSGAVKITSVSGQPKQLSFAATTLSALWVRRVDGYR